MGKALGGSTLRKKSVAVVGIHGDFYLQQLHFIQGIFTTNVSGTTLLFIMKCGDKENDLFFFFFEMLQLKYRHLERKWSKAETSRNETILNLNTF